MKVLLINSSFNQFGITNQSLETVKTVLGDENIDSEIVWLGAELIHACTACNKCNKLKKCIFEEDCINALVGRAEDFDGIIVSAPVVYGEPCEQSCRFFDRLFITAGEKYQRKPASIISVTRKGTTLPSLERLTRYYETNNMPIVTSQYPCVIKVQDNEMDEMGVNAIRTLAKNMAWLLKCIHAGKEAGIEEPIYDEKVRTWFIR